MLFMYPRKAEAPYSLHMAGKAAFKMTRGRKTIIKVNNKATGERQQG